MKYILGDIFQGNFPVTQVYGNNPQYYSQFGLAGHEGIDFGTPNGTPIIAPFDGEILRDTFGDKDYGNFTVVWDPKQLCAVWFCHLLDVTTKVGDQVKKGQLLGHTNNTGNTTGPHLHFNFVETDAQGNRLNRNNGYQGFLNALDPNLVQWQTGNATQGGGGMTDTDKAVGFDRGLIAANKAGLIATADSNQANPDTLATVITNLKADRDHQAGNATKWDQICSAVGLQGDSSQITVDQVKAKMQPISRMTELEQIRDIAIKALT